MRAIFISYRREDSEGHAGRLFEDLVDRFGKGSVFMDVAGIEPGRDFRRVIEQQVASCGVLLAMIGKDWLGVVDAQGKRRLDDPYDFVRLETAHALKRDIPVIPVLVQNAGMPRAEQLPDDLTDLAFRNSVELTHARWNSDVQLLINALLPYVDAAPAEAPATAPPSAATRTMPGPAPAAPAGGGRVGWVIAPLAVLAAGGVGYALWDRGAGPPAAPSVTASSAQAASAPVAITAAPPPAAAANPASASAPTRVAATSSSSAIHPPAAALKPPVAKPPAAATPAVVAAAPAPAPAAATAPTPAPATGPVILAARQEPGLELLGSPGTPAMVTRTIVIKPGTSFVNVTGGEIIRFDVGDKSFVWNFNGQRSSFDLARVAPAAVLERKVTAYVAPNPMYPRRN